MKTRGYFSHGSRWRLVIIAGLLVPNFALAAKSKGNPEACQSQASAAYKKKSVEVAMASIVGSLSELEAASEHDGLERRLEAEKADCLHLARAKASANTGAL